MASHADYKAAKEAFVSGMTGSTVHHVNNISLVAFASLALYLSIRTRLPSPKPPAFLPSFALLVAPLLLSMTLAAHRPLLLACALALPAALLCALLPRRETGTPLPHASPRRADTTTHTGERLAALSAYRAHMMLETVLAILAVDFPVFPRALAKCETYGVSFMDLGVGAFVFAQGVGSARALVHDASYARRPLAPKLAHAARRSAPVLALGLARVLLVKGTQYPEHVSEYGAHWNFFLTLAALPVLQVLLHPLLARMPAALLALLVAGAHELVLGAGLAAYVLHAPRVSLVSANKEGLASLPGYLAIQLLGLSAGTVVLPPSPAHYRRQQRAAASSARPDSAPPRAKPPAPRESDKAAAELFSYAAIYWALLGACSLGGLQVSRRLANLPYVAWVVAHSASALLLYVVLLELLFAPRARARYSPVSGLKLRDADAGGAAPLAEAPPLLDAVNRNSLALFLLANVATGVVNLSMRTMHASDARALGVLGAYALGFCGVAWAARERRLISF
ncbi:GWT1-domain-containing protein [Gloeopeniophorella convolvens]|nr:GWT1-domain-containing protein [Gloeopeniophorella convolvens]